MGSTNAVRQAFSFLEKRVALVTGSTSGIGLGVARGLAARGCNILLNGFGDDKLITEIQQEFSSDFKIKAHHVPADLSDPGDVTRMCDQIRKIHPGGVDILVNNAGFQHVSPIEKFPDETWNAMLAVMLSAPFHLAKRLLPTMREKEGHSDEESDRQPVCEVCHQPGHRAGHRQCPFYKMDNAIGFHGENDPLSNSYPCEINYEGKNFLSVEQAYAYTKSMENHRQVVAEDIMRTTVPRNIQSLSNLVYEFKRWDEEKVSVMKSILEMKMRQVVEVKEALLTTADKVIAEANPGERFWSAGLNAEAVRNTDSEHFPGHNVMGQLWMEIRDELMKEK